MSELYYTPPSDKIFNEVKEEAIKLWSTMGSEPNYSKEKIGRIKDLENVSDNLMYIVAMFDPINQTKLAFELTEEARQAIRERLVSGGAFRDMIMF